MANPLRVRWFLSDAQIFGEDTGIRMAKAVALSVSGEGSLGSTEA